MGAVDLVVQVESPKSVARGLQRVGRAGHELGAVSKGRIFPKFRADLLESAVVARRMLDGEIEETQIPRNPLDVLAQQVVAIAADEEIQAGARKLAVTNGGTIPDRGLFGVHLVDGGGRVGELDEEMVYEARAGQTFLLGASTWRIEEITRELVALDDDAARRRLLEKHYLDERAAENLLVFLREQEAATGALPCDRAIVA